MERPLVSVGIPTYNRSKGLQRTLECITKQTYTNLEIIVSDNCSTDADTQKIVRKFMQFDSRIHYHRQEKNIGPALNFDFLIKKATGEYFMWAADDDEWNNYFIEKCLNEFLNHQDLVLCYSEPKKLNPSGQTEIVHFDSSTVGLKKFEGIKKFLLNNSGNYELYGLMKTKIGSAYTWKNFFAEDHVVVLFLALHGKIGRIEPGLFFTGPGYAGKSPENMVRSFNISRMNIYFGYIFLFYNSVKVVFTYEYGFTFIEKIKIVIFIIRRTLTIRYLKAIGFGMRVLLSDILNSIKNLFSVRVSNK
jgi:glycosyltransferase involved in cell wall biosynthesis